MDNNRFAQGIEPEFYVAGLRNYRSFVRTRMDEAEANDEHAKRFAEKIASRGTPVSLTIMTEDWCGDSALNIPILASLCSKAGVPMRVFRGSETDELKQLYESQGVDHIPVVSLWDGEWNELGRWIEAPAAIGPRKDAWKAEHPQFMELYRKQQNDREAAKQFAALYREFMDEMAAWYRDGLWDETTREIVDLV